MLTFSPNYPVVLASLFAATCLACSATIPQMTDDGRRLVLSCYTYEQFVFLIAEDEPMTCARLDHFGMSVATEAELDEILARAKAFQEHDDRVEIIDKKTDDYEMLAITSIYIGYILPMMVEIQWWDYKQ